MCELRLIVPKNDNGGRPLNQLHRKICDRLVRTFNGFTKTSSTGSSVRENGEIVEESVFDYTIAAQGSEAEAQLYQLAAWIAFVAEQDAVYVRLLDGTVVFVTAPAKEESKDAA